MKGLRACPICPACGWKKFRVIENGEKEAGASAGAAAVIVECLRCSKRISI